MDSKANYITQLYATFYTNVTKKDALPRASTVHYTKLPKTSLVMLYVSTTSDKVDTSTLLSPVYTVQSVGAIEAIWLIR